MTEEKTFVDTDILIDVARKDSRALEFWRRAEAKSGKAAVLAQASRHPHKRYSRLPKACVISVDILSVQTMNLVYLKQGDSTYPAALGQYLADNAPSSIAALGNLEALKHNKLALFCSVRCPGALILKTHDLAQQLAQAGVTVIGGFHSPVEKECLIKR